MLFVYPSFLWALLALAVPIVVHLFNFRRFKKIMFSNVALLREIKVQTQRQRSLKRWLVLAARLLALFFLVMAFAQPFLPKNGGKADRRRKAISIYIDNSFSMNALGKDGTLLQMAKLKARDIVGSFGESDKYQLLTNDFEGRHQRYVSKEEFMPLVDEVKTSAASRRMFEVQTRQAAAAANQPDMARLNFLISDFQETVSSFAPADTNTETYLVPLQAQEQRNISIDSCWLESPFVQLNAANKLRVRLHNYSNEALENGSLSLKINGQQKAVAGFSAGTNANAEAELTFTLTQTGWQACELSIIDNPITFDDKLYFSFEVAPNLQVLSIDGPGVSNNVKNVYATDSYFQLTAQSQNRIDFSLLKKSDLIILNGLSECSSGLVQEVTSYIQNGGDVMVIPSVQGGKSVNNLLSAFGLTFGGESIKQALAVREINLQSSVFREAFDSKAKENMDLPIVQQHFAITASNKLPIEPLLKLQNGEWLAASLTIGKGRLTIVSQPLDPAWGNLQQHAVFVPFMLRSAIISRSTSQLFYRIGKDKYVQLGKELPKLEQGYKLSKQGFETVPELGNRNGQSTLYVADQIKEAGNYTLQSGTATNPSISFNYTSAESNPHCIASDELANKARGKVKIFENMEKNAAASLAELQADTRLWKLCLWLALLFIATEIALIRLLK